MKRVIGQLLNDGGRILARDKPTLLKPCPAKGGLDSLFDDS